MRVKLVLFQWISVLSLGVIMTTFAAATPERLEWRNPETGAVWIHYPLTAETLHDAFRASSRCYMESGQLGRFENATKTELDSEWAAMRDSDLGRALRLAAQPVWVQLPAEHAGVPSAIVVFEWRTEEFIVVTRRTSLGAAVLCRRGES